MSAPEILDDLSLKVFLVGYEFGIKEAATLKSVLVQHPQTKTVYGKYGRQVKGIEGFSETL